jgi:hypothetical protein
MRSAKKSCSLLLLLALAVTFAFAQQKPLREPDVVFVPTPQEVVDEMLKVAKVEGRCAQASAFDGRTVTARAGAAPRASTSVRAHQESEENAAKQG